MNDTDGVGGAMAEKWASILQLMRRAGPFTDDVDVAAAAARFRALRASYRILVIGAGGLGCELLKNLALSGFRKIDVIDLDTIDVSNLNRQFLFRAADVGKSKAEVAAAFVRARVSGVEINAICGRIQDQPEDYYRQFKCIVAGLDNIEARRWINALLVSFVDVDENGEIGDPETIIPLIDGGTEGLKGHARIILPMLTGCFECSLSLFPPQLVFQECTIVNTPRSAAHCVAYAQYAWEREPARGALDKDNAAHMEWIVATARAHAAKFNLSDEISVRTAKGIVGAIIPAIASTNAIVAAAQTNEVLKHASCVALNFDNYMVYNGTAGVYSYAFSFQRAPECAVCGTPAVRVALPAATATLRGVLTSLEENPQYQLKKASISVADTGKLLWMPSQPLRGQLEKNLELPLGDLIASGDVLSVTDPALPTLSLQVTVVLE